MRLKQPRLRGESIAGLAGGMIIGYILWLVGISIGNAVTTVSRWGLPVLILSGVFALCAAAWAFRLRRQRNYLWAAFAFGLPILPVVLTLGVLADTFL